MVTINNGVSVVNGETRPEVEYKGLSTDAKPTNCGINSMYLELDTGNFFYFTGEEWSKVGG